MVESPHHKTKRVGIDISSSGTTAIVLNADDSILAEKTIRDLGSNSSVAGITSLIESLRADLHDFDRIGISVPGLVDRKSGRIEFSSSIPGHSETDLAAEVEAATGVRVLLENDANAAAFGEFSVGAGRGSVDMFYATLGEGVGGAFILDGKIWRGAGGFAGEFGHMPINSEGTRLEQMVSAANIVRRTRSRFHQDSTSSLRHDGEETITLADIISAAERQDDFAQMMLKRTGRYVGGALAGVINLFNIETVVIGGEIMTAKHLVLDSIRKRARELSFAPAFNSTRIVEGSLGGRAAAIGAAIISHSAE